MFPALMPIIGGSGFIGTSVVEWLFENPAIFLVR